MQISFACIHYIVTHFICCRLQSNVFLIASVCIDGRHGKHTDAMVFTIKGIPLQVNSMKNVLLASLNLVIDTDLHGVSHTLILLWASLLLV